MRRMYISNRPYFITSSTQRGLPMVCSSNMNLIIEGILAKAQELHPVRICDYKFMQNHFHMIIMPLDPYHASAFVGYVKTEIAHAINNMLGIKKRSVWEAGYDAPLMLDETTTIEKKAYLYANSAKANLVESVDSYPGVSSWNMYRNKKTCKKVRRVYREKIFQLERPDLSVYEQELVKNELIKTSERLELKLEPDAWMEAFEGQVDKEEANKEILKRVYQLEEEYALKRTEENKKVIGVTALKRQSMAKDYQSKRSGKKMACLGKDKATRVPFIKFFKDSCDTASETYESWKRGDYSAKIPPGMFAPRKPHLCCCIQI